MSGTEGSLQDAVADLQLFAAAGFVVAVVPLSSAGLPLVVGVVVFFSLLFFQSPCWAHLLHEVLRQQLSLPRWRDLRPAMDSPRWRDFRPAILQPAVQRLPQPVRRSPVAVVRTKGVEA